MAAERYPTIDGLRGIAAAAIVLLHLERPGFRMPPGAYTAVDLFFLISGFVIAAAYERRLAQMGVWGFLRTRLIRLYPMYLVGLLILPLYFLAFAVPTPPGEVARSLAAALLFLPSHLSGPEIWESRALFPLDTPLWSLMLEMAVNLAYVLALPWLSRRALLFIVMVSGLILASSQITWNGVDLGWSWATIGWGPPRVAFSFFLGVLIWRSRLPQVRVPAFAVLAAVPALFFAPPLLAVLIGYPLVLIAAARRAGSSQVMTAAGALSYPLYVIHFPLLHWTGHWFARHPLRDTLALPITFGVMVAAAWLALKIWDEPVRRRLTSRIASGAPLA